MVTVTNCLERQKKDGTSFIVLEITGGVELIQSNTSGNFYATVRTCTIPFTGNETVAKTLIGQRIEGDIVKVIVEPYEFTNKRTGEVLMLQHSYAYRPKGSEDLVGHTNVQAMSMA